MSIFPNEQTQMSIEDIGSDSRSKKLKKRPISDPFFTESNKFLGIGIPKKITCDEVILREIEQEKDYFPNFFCQVPGCEEFFNATNTYNDHYNSQHRHVCGTCKKHMPTGHLLDIHLQETHDSYFAILAERKPPVYQCLLQNCALKFNNVNERFEHCLLEHSFPLTFKCPGISLGNVAKKMRIKEKKSNTGKDAQDGMEIESAVDKSFPRAEKMEMENSKKKEKPEKPKQKQEENKPSSHFSFGQSTRKAFIPRKCFAMQKNAKSNPLIKDTSIDMKSIEEALMPSVSTDPLPD